MVDMMLYIQLLTNIKDKYHENITTTYTSYYII